MELTANYEVVNEDLFVNVEDAYSRSVFQMRELFIGFPKIYQYSGNLSIFFLNTESQIYKLSNLSPVP